MASAFKDTLNSSTEKRKERRAFKKSAAVDVAHASKSGL
jgi:hypothetical protein